MATVSPTGDIPPLSVRYGPNSNSTRNVCCSPPDSCLDTERRRGLPSNNTAQNIVSAITRGKFQQLYRTDRVVCDVTG
jgi:hypothetical protein